MSLPSASIDVTLAVSAALILAIGIRGLTMLPSIWRGEITYPVPAPPWWFWGQPLWEGFTRGMPSAIAGAVPAGLFGVLVSIGDDLLGLDQFMIRLLAGIMLGILFVSVGLALTVTLFSRPKALIAPNRRAEAGTVSTWKADYLRRRVKRRV